MEARLGFQGVYFDSPPQKTALSWRPDNSVSGDLLGAAVLLALYRVTTRIPALQRGLETHPVILVYQVRIMMRQLRREGVSRAELEEAVREHGLADLSRVETAVLEMNGTISVIPKESVAPDRLTRVRSRRGR